MPALTAPDLYRLTCWKWRYHFEAMGFDRVQACRLAFLKYMVASGRLRRTA